MSTAELKKETIVKLEGWALKPAESLRNEWVVNAPEGTEIKDADHPEFWRSVAHKLRAFCRVELRAYDGTWMAEFLVIYAERNWAKVKLLQKYELTEAKAPDNTTAYRHKWNGPNKMWTVYRNSDNAEMKDKLTTKDEAILWMNEREKVDK